MHPSPRGSQAECEWKRGRWADSLWNRRPDDNDMNTKINLDNGWPSHGRLLKSDVCREDAIGMRKTRTQRAQIAALFGRLRTPHGAA